MEECNKKGEPANPGDPGRESLNRLCVCVLDAKHRKCCKDKPKISHLTLKTKFKVTVSIIDTDSFDLDIKIKSY